MPGTPELLAGFLRRVTRAGRKRAYLERLARMLDEDWRDFEPSPSTLLPQVPGLCEVECARCPKFRRFPARCSVPFGSRIRACITASDARGFVGDKVMFTRSDFLLEILSAAAHDDVRCLFVGLCSHGLDQGFRIPLNASRYRHMRKTNKIDMMAAIGRPLGSSKM